MRPASPASRSTTSTESTVGTHHIVRSAAVLFDIFINIPSLLMTELAWCIRCIFLVLMFAGLVIVGLGTIAL